MKWLKTVILENVKKRRIINLCSVFISLLLIIFALRFSAILTGITGLLLVTGVSYSYGLIKGLSSAIWAFFCLLTALSIHGGANIIEVSISGGTYFLIGAFIGHSSDTIRRQKKQLQKRENYLESILKVIPDTLLIYNPDGQIVDVWASRPDDLVAPEKEMIGKSIDDWHSEVADQFKDGLNKALSQNTVCVFEYTLKTRGGKQKYETRMRATEDGKVAASIRNITSRKELEKNLRRQTDALNERVKELHCLYTVAKTMNDPELSDEKMLQKTANLIPKAFTEPRSVSARIAINGLEVHNNNALDRESERKIREELILEEENSGFLEVYCETCGDEQRSFLPEERELISVLAQIISQGMRRKLYEERVQEREEDLRVTLQSIGDGVIATDKQGRITGMNPAAEKLTGWSEEEAMSKPIESVFNIESGQDGKTVKDPIRQVLKSREVTTLPHETVLISRDGEKRYIADSASPIKSDNGEIRGAVVVFSDMTEHYKAVQRLRKSEQYNRTILELIPDLIMRVSKEGKYLDVISQSEKDLLLPREELLGKYVSDAFSQKDSENILKTIDRTLKTQKPQTVEYNLEIDRGQKWFEARMVPFNSDEILALIIDITERKQTEERVRYISFHDSLTGLYNRRFLEEEMERLDTERQLPFSAIMADVNGLKLVNDTYGHEFGDEMLKHVSDILQECCRKEDIVGRWGGDEFVILLPKTTEDQAQSIENRIQQRLASASIKDVPLSLTMGIGTKNTPDVNISEILTRAEDDMGIKKLTESRSQKSTVVDTLLKTLSEKSFETERHASRMKSIAMKMGRRLDLPASELSRLDLLITLHDIGKINVPENILTKSGPLTDEEWEKIKKHPEDGYRIARSSEKFAHIAKEVLFHHERWDGKGYPQGISGEAIPFLSRILAIVDAYDVMTSGRPYKQPMSHQYALDELEKSAGNDFDPNLVQEFISMMQKCPQEDVHPEQQ